MSAYMLSKGGADVRQMWIYPIFDRR